MRQRFILGSIFLLSISILAGSEPALSQTFLGSEVSKIDYSVHSVRFSSEWSESKPVESAVKYKYSFGYRLLKSQIRLFSGSSIDLETLSIELGIYDNYDQLMAHEIFTASDFYLVYSSPCKGAYGKVSTIQVIDIHLQPDFEEIVAAFASPRFGYGVFMVEADGEAIIDNYVAPEDLGKILGDVGCDPYDNGTYTNSGVGTNKKSGFAPAPASEPNQNDSGNSFQGDSHLDGFGGTPAAGCQMNTSSSSGSGLLFWMILMAAIVWSARILNPKAS